MPRQLIKLQEAHTEPLREGGSAGDSKGSARDLNIVQANLDEVLLAVTHFKASLNARKCVAEGLPCASLIAVKTSARRSLRNLIPAPGENHALPHLSTFCFPPRLKIVQRHCCSAPDEVIWVSRAAVKRIQLRRQSWD